MVLSMLQPVKVCTEVLWQLVEALEVYWQFCSTTQVELTLHKKPRFALLSLLSICQNVRSTERESILASLHHTRTF